MLPWARCTPHALCLCAQEKLTTPPDLDPNRASGKKTSYTTFDTPILASIHFSHTPITMDPFQIRMECLGLVKRLTASQQSIAKVVDFAQKHAAVASDDIWECIVSECSKVRVSDPFCDMDSRLTHYLDLSERTPQYSFPCRCATLEYC